MRSPATAPGTPAESGADSADGTGIPQQQARAERVERTDVETAGTGAGDGGRRPVG
ncbi:hypothetical protein [Streptomyces sp. B1866]|uniref:hypothetical protein n=1 Tax=Streptomyces sp. B1866 TaxID=3075431 RepID=UPI0028A23A43|nr:hypothetical protein [Streptomyces sp. B1866]